MAPSGAGATIPNASSATAPCSTAWSPIQLLSDVSDAVAGLNYSFALKTDGSLWAWGENSYGYLGDGTTIDRCLPVQVLTGVASVATAG